MHDVFESVANYDLVNLIHDFIYVDKLVTIKFLNERIQNFSYSSADKFSTPLPLAKSIIKEKKN